tara:strand:+ start:1121 stop:2896 length:1776 start_codon:yes stop_codon:yes gene_type:complete
MAQDDYNIPNQSFPSFRSDLNSALSAINSSNSGTSRPSSAVAGTIWLDTSGGVTAYALKFFDGSDDITLANINTTANTVDFVDASVASDLLNDTSPQLGGNLDVLAREIITSTTNGNIKLTPDGTGLIEIKGATNPGSIQLNCESNSHGIKLTSPPHSSGQSYELKFPTGNVTAGKVLKVDSISGSGATAVGQLSFGDVSGGTSWQSSVKTANFTASAGEGYFVNTSGGAFEIDLPSSPSVGDQIEFVDFSRSFGTNNLTLDQGSNKFQGNTSPKPVYDVSGQSINIVYSGSTQGWIPLSDDDVTLETQQSYTVDFLCIAGGAGGGWDQGGGGGAGGYRNSYSSEASGRNSSSETSLSLTPGTVYTITVGGGGAGRTSSGGRGANGNTSSISGSDITDISSIGGGGGGSNPSPGYKTGGDGGSGGGGGGDPNQAGGTGTANQGYDGGQKVSNDCGGGGGAGEDGNTDGVTDGGDGLSSSITGSAVTRAGGGGGMDYSNNDGNADGGDGGGGLGGTTSPNRQAADGSANTGGGGGGGSGGHSDQTGGDGGSGVVILRMATSDYSGTTSGSPTVTTSGSDTILTFTGDGSYTA